MPQGMVGSVSSSFTLFLGDMTFVFREGDPPHFYGKLSRSEPAMASLNREDRLGLDR